MHYARITACLLMMLCCTWARGNVTLSLSDSSGDPGRIDLTAAQLTNFEFTLTVTLVSDQPFTGVSFLLQAPGAGSTKFSISGRTLDPNSPLDDPTSTASQVTNTTAAKLDPTSNVDLGYGASDPFTNIDPGTYVLETINLKTSGLSLGQLYTIQIVSASLTDADFNDIPSSGGTYVVATPEPSALALVVLLALAMLKRRRAPVCSL